MDKLPEDIQTCIYDDPTYRIKYSYCMASDIMSNKLLYYNYITIVQLK